MSDIKQKFGTANQAMTITLASLANTALRESTAVDNTTNLFEDVQISGKIKTAAADVSATGYVNIYAYGSADAGTTYDGSASGSDAAYSGEKTNLKFVKSITANANGTTFEFGFSLLEVFKTIPASWGLVIENQTAQDLDSTGSNHAIVYQGVYRQAG